ncbi:MAG: MFS transporter, partial [bacterium]|nr:MFS transporter [bacterium]
SFISFGLAKNLIFLFICRFLQGIFSSAAMPTAQAYVADATKKEERTKFMGRLGAATALGFILGPAFGGLLSHGGFQLPFFVAAAISFLNFLFVLFWLPEIVSKKKELFVAKEGLFNFSRVWRGLKSSLFPYFIMLFLWSYGLSNNQVAIPLLGMEKLKLSSASIGWLFTLMSVTSVIIQGLFLGKINRKFREVRIAKIGLFIMALGLFLMAFSGSFIFLALTMIILAMGSAFSRPTLNSIISKSTPESQGVSMGTATSFEAMGRILGPLTGGFLFQHFQGFGPFWMASSLIFIFLLSHRNKQKAAS